MRDARVAVLVPRVRPPDVLWFPFAVLVLLGLGTNLTATVYMEIVTLDVVAGDASLQWQAFPFGIGMLAVGITALLGAATLWRQRKGARTIALVVLPLFIAAGAANGLVVDGPRVNPFVALSLLFPAVAWAIFFLPSVRNYYKRLVR